MKKIRKRFLTVILLFFVLSYNLTTYFHTFGEYVSKIETNETGIINNVVTINELEADYNYYMGLNYVSSDGTLPTLENKNLYNENNLIETKITYYGNDILNNNKGFVSITEQQDTFIYYKMYVINNNGTQSKSDDYIEIELIDNPFSDRPNDKAFNGWTTDYLNTKIKYNNDYYTRTARIPVSYFDNVPNPIDINFYANWIDAKVSFINNSINWQNAFASLDEGQMQPIGGQAPIYDSVVGLYIKYNVAYNNNYPTGALNDNGQSINGTCYNYNDGCTYYLSVGENSLYNKNLSYYNLNNGMMTLYQVPIVGYEELPRLEQGTILSGYYRQVNLMNSNIEGYYSLDGTLQKNTVCTNNCTYYELVNYYDNNGNVNVADGTTIYYYLATRDTNIIVMNESLSTKWTQTENKPFTLTSAHNDFNNDITWNISNQYITCYADTRIENIRINSNATNSSANPSSNTTTTRYIYGNYNNLKIGRGIVQTGTYKNFNGVIGGDNNTTAIGNASNVLKYKLIVESGWYNNITLTNGASNTNRDKYIEAIGVYGSDYDKVSKKETLDVYFVTAGSWGAGNYYASKNEGITFDTIIKSGNFGTGKYDHTTGVYIGGRSYGTHYTSRRIKVEGGWIYNLIGGPMTASNRANINDTYAYVTGGSIDMVTGGAGTSTTYGNRVVSVTGGTVNYSVFGGSNSYSGGTSDGKLTGSSYVHIGGNATIGNQEYIDSNNRLWGAESGSVFGIGNGNNTSSTIGSNENSNIIITGGNILGNVYGGGNYSATGVESTKSTTYTNIKILGGTINGSVYGGGNNNGSGSSNKQSSINIDILDGVINGSVYGGSKALGTIYGNVNLNIKGGLFNNSIYGGGQGNQTSITRDININYGDNQIENTPILINNLYGGSEFGSVNTSSSYNTNIIINKGIINGSVFGGAKGNETYRPTVYGNSTVTINGGEISNVFGANDISGTLSGKTEIYLKGGNIINVYGGGNKTSQNTTNVYLQGSNVTNIFGGSNESGDVTTSNITVTDGFADNIYGGNNTGGITNVSNINLKGGIATTVYGGGNNTSQVKSNVNLNGSNVTTIFGGSNESGDVDNSNVITTKGSVDTIYGGNNRGGKTITTNVTVKGGTINTIYGGGKLTDTSTSNVNINNSLDVIYGGGEDASVTTTYITINKGEISTIFGGSNKSGDVETSNIKIKDGNIINIYGGNNTGGITYNSILNVEGSTIENIYGGGNNAETYETNININRGTIENIYGGGNDTNGNTAITNLNLKNGNITNVYGGGNKAETVTSNINLKGSTIENVYGGGNESGIVTANVNLYSGDITNVFGGSNKSGNVETSNIKTFEMEIIEPEVPEEPEEPEVPEPEVPEIPEVPEEPEEPEVPQQPIQSTRITMTLNYSVVEVNPYWQDTNYNSVATIDVILTNNTDEIITEYDAYITLANSTLYSNYSSTKLNENNGTYTFDETNVYTPSPNSIAPGQSYTFQFTLYSKLMVNEFQITEYGVYGNEEIENPSEPETPEPEVPEIPEVPVEPEEPEVPEPEIPEEPIVTELKVLNIYGGNNQGGILDNSIIDLNRGTYNNIYGGGNQAVLNNPSIILNGIVVNERVYGGGNQALVTNSTNLKIINSTIGGSIFGGGNAGIVGEDTNVYVSNSNILESVYAGGNGSTAVVIGNTNLDIEGTTSITKHVFGGGNAANTGSINNLVSTVLNISGANIGGNVYGAGNTSIVYGTTNVNIGVDTLTKDNLIKDNIIINGSVFGGGEANEQGSENYDYSFISVTDGTNININGNNHDELTINGSIFGSGNASSTEGYSYINISNYGTVDDYKTNISIQRADLVIINNSVIELMGTTDRTNEYSTVLFSLSRIKHLKLKNNSSLYLNTGANLLEEYTSAVDIDGIEKLQNVTFENDQIIRNVNNRIYIKGGKNLNIATNENATAYGIVNGMTFFGLYTKDRNDELLTGLYDEYNFGDNINNNDLYLFDAGSYVLGLHKNNHDMRIDGFYSNYENEGTVYVDYVKPTPEDSTYYMWSIGEQVISMEINLTASKYLTLGTEELGMLNYSTPNTTFSIVGFNYNELDPNVNLIEEQNVPRVAETQDIADNNMSLVMKSTNSGWITKGQTTFLTSKDGISGTTFYKSENSTEVPSFQFYIYHSKNLGTSGQIGSVTISFVVTVPIDDLTSEVQRVNLIVNLDRQLYNTNDYEAAMTNGKEYDLFASSNVKLTSNGSLSAYYSLFVENTDNIYKNGYHRSLVSTYVFPVNTKITLLNLNENSTNEYYYYVVNENDYNIALQQFNTDKEVSYNFDKFIRMGSTSNNNNYNDAINNDKYYNSNNRIAMEEFIVIVDFADSNITEDVLDKSLLIELRNAEDETVVSVLGIEQERMKYSLYTNSNAVIDVEGILTSTKVYPGNLVNLNVTTDFKRKIINSEVIYDTNYFEQQLGIKISYLDSEGNQVTGSSLLGVTYEYDGVIYYPRMDGSVRIRLAEKMANVYANIIIHTTESVATGNYTMVIESFGSPDGIYYGGLSSDTDTLPIDILNTVYGLTLTMEDHIFDKNTGNNLNNNNDLTFNLKYSSGLLNPKLRMSLYRRNYDSIYSIDYEIVDLQEYVSDTIIETNKEYEYLLADMPLSDANYSYLLNENLKTGTYKFVISLYDNDTYIGDVHKNIIIKERYNE